MSSVELSCFIEKKLPNSAESKIPRNLIQTYKHNKIHPFIHSNIMRILDKNVDFNYYLITDEIGIDLIKTHFDEYTLNAFLKLNIGSAKGDFLRYIAMYIYGGVYLDLDANITISLSSWINPNVEHVFFLDSDKNIEQWRFMTSPNNPIIFNIIQEMVSRIYNNETNIFIATGPTLFTDVIYNMINNSSIYNTKKNISKEDRFDFFIKNKHFHNGVILYNECDIHTSFESRMRYYDEKMLYNNDKYIVTFDEPTPHFYK